MQEKFSQEIQGGTAGSPILLDVVHHSRGMGDQADMLCPSAVAIWEDR